MKLICDTDILSVFAKVDELGLLQEAFPEGTFMISESVYDELSSSMKEGFDFPKEIFEMCEVTPLEQEEVSLYEKRREKSRYLALSGADLRTLIVGAN